MRDKPCTILELTKTFKYSKWKCSRATAIESITRTGTENEHNNTWDSLLKNSLLDQSSNVTTSSIEYHQSSISVHRFIHDL